MDNLHANDSKNFGHIYDIDGTAYKITHISFADNEIVLSSENDDIHITRKLVKL